VSKGDVGGVGKDENTVVGQPDVVNVAALPTPKSKRAGFAKADCDDWCARDELLLIVTATHRGPHKGRTYVNYQLVESVRTSNGPRQKTICSLGDLGPGSREEWARRARKLEHAVAGQEDLFEPSDAEAERALEKAKTKRGNAQRAAQEQQLYGGERITVDPKRITTERHREAGTVHVGYELWKRPRVRHGS